MSVFCPKCYPNGIMYAGSITWKLCRSCVADESAEYGQGSSNDARDTEIARLSKIEERAKDVTGLPAGTGEYSPTRLRSETAQYILEGDLHTQTTKGDT